MIELFDDLFGLIFTFNALLHEIELWTVPSDEKYLVEKDEGEEHTLSPKNPSPHL